MAVLMNISCLFLITITVLSNVFQPALSCSSTRLREKVKRPYDRRRVTRRGKCMDGSEFVPLLCQNVNFLSNETYFPNVLGHEYLREAYLDLQNIWPLAEINCSPDTEQFFCNAFFPQCKRYYNKMKMKTFNRMLLPCRSLCETVRDGCVGNLTKHTGYPWFPPLKCDLFPTRNCLSSLRTHLVEHKKSNQNHTKIIKEKRVKGDVYLTVVNTAGGTKEGGTEKGQTQAVIDRENQGEGTEELDQDSKKTVHEVQVKNDVFLIIKEGDKRRTAKKGTEREGHAQTSQNERERKPILCKNSTIGARPEGIDPNEKNEADREGPTDCVKGHYKCRHSTVMSYMNGVLHCCFYRKQIAHTVTFDKDDDKIKSSCLCSYPSPKLRDDC